MPIGIIGADRKDGGAVSRGRVAVCAPPPPNRFILAGPLGVTGLILLIGCVDCRCVDWTTEINYHWNSLVSLSADGVDNYTVGRDFKMKPNVFIQDFSYMNVAQR